LFKNKNMNFKFKRISVKKILGPPPGRPNFFKKFENFGPPGPKFSIKKYKQKLRK